MRRALLVLGVLACGCADDGKDGSIGPTGPQGIVGNVGTRGPTGPIGPTGQQGDPGVAGAVGEMGPAGPAGPKGATGATGTTGATGPAGTNGTPGAAGPTGATGPAGSGVTKAALYVVEHAESVPGLSEATSNAACVDANDVLLSGACDGLMNSMRVYHWQAVNFATVGAASSWQCWAYNTTSGPMPLTARAYCLAVP